MAKQAKRESAEYLGLLFQPVPYSVATPHGMPREFEKYYKDSNFAICNVPPKYMFKGMLTLSLMVWLGLLTVVFAAKCYKPSRLCAVFQLSGAHVSNEQIATESEWDNLGDAFRNPVQDDGEVDKDLVV